MSNERPDDTLPERDASPTEEANDQNDRNLGELLARANRPPRIAAAARVRILARLRASRPGGGASAPTGKASRSLPSRVVEHLRGRARIVVGSLALAAALVLVIGIALRGSAVVHRNDGLGPMRLTLADGTDVTLDRGAELVEIGTRELRLVRGAALLDVAKADRPLVVESREGRAVALGTRFAISVDDAETRASVARGSVRLEAGSGRELLHAGEQGVLTRDRPPLRRAAPRLSYLTSWAREAPPVAEASTEPVRKGSLVARDPQWGREWPLAMRELTVDVHVEDGVARTTLDQTFFNHVNRDLEGVYSFPLPPDASISRLAMYVDGKLVDGGIVPRERGRDVYESIVYRRRDPALLEWMAGNLFRVRVFPLPARTEKRLLLSYTQPLARLYDATRIAVPLPRVDAPIDRVTFHVRVVRGEAFEIASSTHAIEVTGDGADRIVTFHGDGQRLGSELCLTLRSKVTEAVQIARFPDAGGDVVRAVILPDAGADTRAPRARRWVLLFDTSASRDGDDLRAQEFLVGRLLREWDEDDRFTVVAFDATRRLLPGGLRRVGDADPREIAAWLSGQAKDGVGNTDLEAALRDAVDLLAKDGDGEPHILYVGDGIPTAGQTGIHELGEIVRGHATFVGVSLGARADATLLRSLAEKSGGLYAAMSPGEDLGWRAFDLIATLNTPRILGITAKLADPEGRPLDGVDALVASTQASAGEPIDVLARLPPGRVASKLLLSGIREGKPWAQDVSLAGAVPAARALPRLWAKRRVEALIEDGASKHEEEIARLGLDHFLITPFTSLLVLENDAMYRQFKVQRGAGDDWARYPAPTTIPVRHEPVGTEGLEPGGGAVLVRSPIEIFATPPVERLRTLFKGSDGGLGLVGRGSGGGGFGNGHGRLGGSHRDRAEDSHSWSEGTTIVTTKQLRERGDPGGWVVPVASATSFAAAAPVAQRVAFEPSAPVTVTLSGEIRVGTLFNTAVHSDMETWRGTSGAAPSAIALHSSADPRLDDLTEFVPALFGDELDRERERVAALEADGRRGSASEPARDLWSRAVARRAPARYRITGGGVVTVEREGRFQSEGTTATSLAERSVYDGRVLSTFYPELGLAVRRPVGGAEAALFARSAPFVLPRLDAVMRGYDVSVGGERSLRMTPVGGGVVGDNAPAIEIDLDADLEVVALRRVLGGRIQTSARLERAGDRLTIHAGGQDIELTRELVEPSALDATIPAGSIAVEVPLREPSYWSARAAVLEPGTPDWLSAERRLLAAHAALGHAKELWATLAEIRVHRPVLRGELVLGSRGAREAPNEAAVARLGEDDPVARYLRASWSMAHDGTTQRLEALGGDRDARGAAPAGLVRMLASYRALLGSIEADRRREALARYRSFGSSGGYAPLRLVAMLQIDNRWGYDDAKATAKLWTEAGGADPTLLPVMEAGAGRALYRAGLYDEAAAALERAMEDARRSGEHPEVDPLLRTALFSSSRGEAGWRLFWARYRASALRSGDPEMLLSLLDSMQQSAEQEDASAVIAALRTVHIDDPDVASSLARALIQLGRPSDAWPILRPLLDGAGARSADLLELASVVAEREGQAREAARYLERAIDARDGIELDAARQLYKHLFELTLRAADAERGDAARLDAPLAVASRWRRIDPDNAEIDRLCGGAFFAAGKPEEGWRHISSIVERHPAEGDAYADVAGVLERQGLLAEADRQWSRATEVEPTNPTWLLRRAQNFYAAGDEARGRELLGRIAAGTWQARFSNVVSQAKHLLEPGPR